MPSNDKEIVELRELAERLRKGSSGAMVTGRALSARDIRSATVAIDALLDRLESQAGRGGDIQAALSQATVISAYSISDPLAVRIVFGSDEDRAAFADAIDGELQAGRGGEEDMVLVPREPTEAMLHAYEDCPYEGAEDKWRAMLAALALSDG